MSIANHLNRKDKQKPTSSICINRNDDFPTSNEMKVGPYLWAGCLRVVQMAVWKSWLMQTLWGGQRTFRQGSLVASGPKQRSETQLGLLEANAV